MIHRLIPSLAFAALSLAVPTSHAADSADGFVSIFNGKDLTGWKPNNETPDSFKVVNGEIHVVNGRAHLFYVGADGNARFKNFELKAKVKHADNSNSGIYFHTEFQDNGWPSKGHECQVNSTTHKDPKKTGGLYAVKDILNKAPVADDEWFDYEIAVKDNHVVIKINGEVTVDWTEPADWTTNGQPKGSPGRKISPDGGTIALQAHDPVSRVAYKDLFLKIND